MSDVFREVDEDLRRQRLEELWKQYGSWVIGAAAVFVLVVGISLYWKDAQERKRAKLSDEYAAAVELISKGKDDEGLAALQALADKTGGGYKAISLMTEAQVLHRQGKVDEAVAAYDKISDGNIGGAMIAELAQVKAAWALADTASYEEISGRVSGLVSDDGVWRYPAKEILAYAAFKNGMTDAARSSYTELVSDLAAPQGVAERAAIMMRVLGPAPKVAVPELTDPLAGDGHVHEAMPEEDASETVADEESTPPETDVASEVDAPAGQSTDDTADGSTEESSEPTE